MRMRNSKGWKTGVREAAPVPPAALAPAVVSARPAVSRAVAVPRRALRTLSSKTRPRSTS
jgi:hypothetical protein